MIRSSCLAKVYKLIWHTFQTKCLADIWNKYKRDSHVKYVCNVDGKSFFFFFCSIFFAHPFFVMCETDKCKSNNGFILIVFLYILFVADCLLATFQMRRRRMKRTTIFYFSLAWNYFLFFFENIAFVFIFPRRKVDAQNANKMGSNGRKKTHS